MILDLILAGLIIFAIAHGFNRGFLPTLFALIGYLGGGILGLFAAKEITQEWSSLITLIGIYLVAIFLGAQIGSWLMAKVGAGFRKQVLFGPFKFVDSILGGFLNFLQLIIFVSILKTIIEYFPIFSFRVLTQSSTLWSYMNGNLIIVRFFLPIL